MIFFAGVTAILCVFGLGLLWPHRTPLPAGATIWGYFVKALYFSWIWFLISFHTNLGDGARLIALVLCTFVAMQVTAGRLPAVAASDEKLKFLSLRYLVMTIAFIAISFPALTSFGTIFSVWDAVVSWNRWGVELSNNEYLPLTAAAYPILWPAVWSLIYEAQGATNLWFVAKASIAAPLLALGVLVTDQIKRPQLISGAMLALLVTLSISSQTLYAVSGYMDLPLAMTGLAALLLLISAVEEISPERRNELFMLAVVTSAIAMVTKQAGIIFAGIVGLCALYEAFKKRITFGRLVLYGLIVFFPLVSYLQIYFGIENNAFGNFDYLNEVADKTRGETGEFAYAVSLFQTSLPGALWPLLLVGVVLNLIFFRSYRGVIGLLALAAGAVIFIIFARCCTYGIRNGYIVLSFATASAFIGYSSAEAWVARRLPAPLFAAPEAKIISLRAPLIAGLAAALIGVSMLSIEWPEERLVEYDREIRPAQIGYKFPNQFLLDHGGMVEKSRLLTTPYMIAKYLPITEDKFFYCPQTNALCLERAKNQIGAGEILAFSPVNFENAESLAFIEESLKRGKAKVIAKSGPLTLYVFKID